MNATYQLKPYELTVDFFESLKQTFKDRDIVLSVKAIQDETDFLLSTEANRKQLFEALEAAKKGEFVHTMTLEELDAMIDG
jgi:hypothetical protein